MQKLDKSWIEEVPNYTDSCKTTYIAGASAFQERAIKELKKQISKHKDNFIGIRTVGLKIALEIIKNLKSH